MIRIRAFRTTQDRESCELFAEGHEQVLRDFGVEKVTSANKSWMDNPNVYVLLVESLEDGRVYGSSRIHVYSEGHPLPVQDAIGDMDPEVHKMVEADAHLGTGEMCALWNAKEIRGSGVSIILTKASVAKVGVEVANILNMKVLWVLCAPYTVSMVEKAGFEVVRSLGQQGTFPYPKPDLPATVLRLGDTDTLTRATEYNRNDILDLRNSPIQNKIERGPKGELIIEYNLLIKDL